MNKSIRIFAWNWYLHASTGTFKMIVGLSEINLKAIEITNEINLTEKICLFYVKNIYLENHKWITYKSVYLVHTLIIKC